MTRTEQLEAALADAYAFITQPTRSEREHGEVWLSTYRRTSREYNTLTAKMRAALMPPSPQPLTRTERFTGDYQASWVA